MKKELNYILFGSKYPCSIATLAGLRPARFLCLWNCPGNNTSGLTFSIPGNLSNPGIEPTSLASPAFARGFFTTAPPGNTN